MKTLEEITIEFFETQKLYSKIPEAIEQLKKIGFDNLGYNKYSKKVKFHELIPGAEVNNRLSWEIEKSKYSVMFFISLSYKKYREIVKLDIGNLFIPDILLILEKYFSQFGEVFYEDAYPEENRRIEDLRMICFVALDNEVELQIDSDTFSINGEDC